MLPSRYIAPPVHGTDLHRQLFGSISSTFLIGAAASIGHPAPARARTHPRIRPIHCLGKSSRSGLLRTIERERARTAIRRHNTTCTQLAHQYLTNCSAPGGAAKAFANASASFKSRNARYVKPVPTAALYDDCGLVQGHRVAKQMCGKWCVARNKVGRRRRRRRRRRGGVIRITSGLRQTDVPKQPCMYSQHACGNLTHARATHTPHASHAHGSHASIHARRLCVSTRCGVWLATL